MHESCLLAKDYELTQPRTHFYSPNLSYLEIVDAVVPDGVSDVAAGGGSVAPSRAGCGVGPEPEDEDDGDGDEGEAAPDGHQHAQDRGHRDAVAAAMIEHGGCRSKMDATFTINVAIG